MINDREKSRIEKIIENLYERIIELGLTSVKDVVTKIESVNLWLVNGKQDYFYSEEIEIMIEMGNRWLQSTKESNNDSKKRKDLFCVQLDTSLLCKSINEKASRNIWLGDSDASCHMSKSDDGYVSYRNISSYIQLGNGENSKSYQNWRQTYDYSSKRWPKMSNHA
jgi:hypothetical protein